MKDWVMVDPEGVEEEEEEEQLAAWSQRTAKFVKTFPKK
jgi:hypothetical protein